MAGGKHAHHVPCMVCLGDRKLVRATRIREGVESDNYVCDLGHDFGLDWRTGPAPDPQWPPSTELRAALETDGD